MSLGAGSLALQRMKLLVPSTKTPLEWIVAGLKKHRIDPIRADEERELASGWCHPYSGEPMFDDVSEHTYDNTLIFGMRSDSKKIPGTYFKLQLKAALAALNLKDSPESQESKRRVPKKIRDAIRDRIRAELLQGTLPSIRMVEIAWHLDSNEIWLLSGSKSAADEFIRLFEETFEIPIVRLNAGLLSIDFERIQLGLDTSVDKLLQLIPVNLLQKSTARLRHGFTDISENA